MDEPRRPSRESVQAAVEVMDPETRDQWEYINLRCLALCIGMLERVNGVQSFPSLSQYVRVY